MPTLMLRGLSSQTMAAIKSLARDQAVSTSEAAAFLIEIALAHRAARQLGAELVNADRTPEQRTIAARHAAAERWRKP